MGTARPNDALWRSGLYPHLLGHVPAHGHTATTSGDDTWAIFRPVTHQALQEPLSSK